MENNQQSFWQFSDQLRLHTNNLANLSLNDSIWSNSCAASKRPEERRNFDIRVGGELNSSNSSSDLKPKESDFNVWRDLKPKESDFNGLNRGWNDLKPKESAVNGFGGGWNDFKLKDSSDFNGFGAGWNDLKLKDSSDFNGFNHAWKVDAIGGGSSQNLDLNLNLNMVGLNGGYNKGIYSKPSVNLNRNTTTTNNNNSNAFFNIKGYKNGGVKREDELHMGKSGKKNKNINNSNNSNNSSDNNSKNGVEKRFKTLPPSESLPRNETVGGYIFVCNNDTMQENLRRQLFGLPPRYRDSVRAITPGLPLFLYNYSTHQLHGVFEAASFGGTNIDPTAWEDKKNPGESRFPAQVQVMTRKVCVPLEEDSFRPILHHYDGPKFRLELNIPEALSLLDIFEENSP